ncbi:hypothetical protein [Microbacter margulisiae]|uniref:Uncharacterized protein n=1 Tax=Microbacter margulisiae TaxID=1350067 RepID=A0A7W5H3D6_9PORP|nr:hypothetical protein [Microbacter margulisiae]MBB3188361.1 hypothetical protein [Microbacter margulisiae]
MNETKNLSAQTKDSEAFTAKEGFTKTKKHTLKMAKIAKPIVYIKLITLTLSIGLFAVSITQDCFSVSDGTVSSLSALLGGFWGMLFTGGSSITWLANPILLTTWILMLFTTKQQLLLIGSALSSSLSSLFLLFHDAVLDEAGNKYLIVGYSTGYWLWLASSLVLFIGSLVLFFVAKQYPDERSNNDDELPKGI